MPIPIYLSGIYKDSIRRDQKRLEKRFILECEKDTLDPDSLAKIGVDIQLLAMEIKQLE